MFQSLRSRILLLVFTIVMVTSTVLIFLVQKETEEAMLTAQEENARNVLHIIMLTIENQYQSIVFYKEATLERRKEELKNILQIVMTELNYIYNEYLNGIISEEEAKKRAIIKIKQLRYDDGVGYFWINDTGKPIPKLIMHPTMPEMVGIILDDPKFNTALGKEENIFKAFLDVGLKSGTGYVDYLWPKPTSAGLTSYQPKISYVSLFEPWNWIIGTGVYIDDINREAERRIEAVINELEESLSKVTIAKTGYVYIFTGDKKMLIHPNIERGSDVSGLIDQATGYPIFDELVEAAKRPDKSLRYLWDSPEHKGEYIFWKKAFTEHFEPLDWYLSSSVYEAEIEAPSNELTVKILYFSVIILLTAFLFSYILSQNLIKPLKMLSLSVKDIDKKGIENVDVPILGTIETKNLGRIITETLNSLHESKDKLEKYQDHLEEEVRDRTLEVEKSNKELIIAKDAAEASNKAKSTFLANMSHEIRTPMNAILGFTDVLFSEEKDPSKREYISNILSCGNVLLSLINDILDISKVEAGKLELQYSAVSIKSIIDEMKAIFSNRIIEKGLDLIINDPPEHPETLLLEKTRLRQILINLIGNAVKFTDKGIIEISIDYIFPKETEYCTLDLLISIKDTGSGIPDDQIEKIFNPFEQQEGQKMSKFGGTGLGLAITRRLLEIMNGEIKVHSEPGKGSTFKIILKETEIVSTHEMDEDRKQKFDFDSILFKKKTLLIADDIDFNRELLIKYLSNYDFTILEAKDGFQTIEIARKKHPDLILLDMKMPRMNGYQAMEILKKDKELKAIPIIAVTASAMKNDEQIINTYCNSYLKKPVKKTEIIEALMRFLPHTLKTETISEGIIKMIPPPGKVLKEIRDLAIIGDIDELVRQINQIDPQYKKFSGRVKDLAKLYQIEEIIDLIDEFSRKET